MNKGEGQIMTIQPWMVIVILNALFAMTSDTAIMLSYLADWLPAHIFPRIQEIAWKTLLFYSFICIAFWPPLPAKTEES